MFHACLALALPLLSIGRTCPGSQAPQEWEGGRRSRVIEAVLGALEDNYVFPEVATRMASEIRRRVRSGAYDHLKSGSSIAAQLQTDLIAICRDRHLAISYEPGSAGVQENPSPEQEERWRVQQRRNNFGFRKLEFLSGNVGYLELTGFAAVEEESVAVASAAMSYLAGADALIVDLRRNGGGAPAMVAFLCTYLLGSEPVHLNSLEEPRRGTSHQWWTLPHVPGRRFGPDKPVFVLTSPRTFSAAEEFSYNLRCLERATLVGETTGGGAHPVDAIRIDRDFTMMLPFARAVNPITGTNWEGVGVEPHLGVEAYRALEEAHVAALDALIDACGEDEEQRREELLAAVARLEQGR